MTDNYESKTPENRNEINQTTSMIYNLRIQAIRLRLIICLIVLVDYANNRANGEKQLVSSHKMPPHKKFPHLTRILFLQRSLNFGSQVSTKSMTVFIVTTLGNL